MAITYFRVRRSIRPAFGVLRIFDAKQKLEDSIFMSSRDYDF